MQDALASPYTKKYSAILDQELHGTANPAYIVPYEDPEQPIWKRRVDTKSKMETKLHDLRQTER